MGVDPVVKVRVNVADVSALKPAASQGGPLAGALEQAFVPGAARSERVVLLSAPALDELAGLPALPPAFRGAALSWDSGAAAEWLMRAEFNASGPLEYVEVNGRGRVVRAVFEGETLERGGEAVPLPVAPEAMPGR